VLVVLGLVTGFLNNGQLTITTLQQTTDISPSGFILICSCEKTLAKEQKES